VDTPESAMAVKTIEHNFPCFTFLDLMENGEMEFTVKCREEDICSIQNIIKMYV
jgi:hypothetical protein